VIGASSFWSVAAEHLFSFLGGIVVGFLAANRYRVERRNGV
jgi:hypothetical protein